MFQEGTFSEAKIKAFCDFYGTSPRMVYEKGANHQIQERMLNELLQMVSYRGMDTVIREGFTSRLSDFISEYIMFIGPGVNRWIYSLDIPTTYVYEKLRDSLSTNKLEAMASLYDMFVKLPITRNNVGYMWRDAIGSMFHLGGEWKVVPLKQNAPGPKFAHWQGTTSEEEIPLYLCIGYQGSLFPDSLSRMALIWMT
jgi:hypothetical protein